MALPVLRDRWGFVFETKQPNPRRYEMIEVNKNTLAGAFGALGKMICRTSPLALCKSVKVEAAEGKLRLSTCGLNEEVSFELETDSEEVFC